MYLGRYCVSKPRSKTYIFPQHPQRARTARNDWRRKIARRYTLSYTYVIHTNGIFAGGPGWFWLSRGSKYNIAGDDYSMLEIYHGILRAAMNAPKIPFGKILI